MLKELWMLWQKWKSDNMDIGAHEVNEVVLKMMYYNCINWDSDKLKAQLGMKSKYDPEWLALFPAA